jgi:hypothetical protein
MNEQHFQTIAERFATKRGLSAQSSGTIIDVPVNYTAVIDYVDEFYEFMVSAYDEEVGVTTLLTKDEFRSVCVAILAKRVQWVRQRTYGVRDGATIQISNTTPIPGPIFALVYLFGKVESQLGVIFLPMYEPLKELSVAVTAQLMRKYLAFVTRMKHYYAFSEGMPSQEEGTWAYLLHATDTIAGTVITGPSKEGKPSDAYLAAIIKCAIVQASFFYGASYGVIQAPELTQAEYFDSFGKGIGE